MCRRWIAKLDVLRMLTVDVSSSPPLVASVASAPPPPPQPARVRARIRIAFFIRHPPAPTVLQPLPTGQRAAESCHAVARDDRSPQLARGLARDRVGELADAGLVLALDHHAQL